MKHTTRLPLLACAAALLLASCGSSTAKPAASGATTVAPAATTVAAAATTTAAAAGSATTTAVAAGSQVSANTATQPEIAAVLTANGVPSADRWAKEVTEYRPYPVDPTWASLRKNLAKYNPDPAVLEKIIASLKP
jgi:hypothetical protein